MAIEEVSLQEGSLTRSGIFRYDILKQYQLGNAVELDDICDVTQDIEQPEQEFLEP